MLTLVSCFLASRGDCFFAAVSFTQMCVLLNFTLILHVHFDDREVADPPLQGIWIFYCMYQSITLNSEKNSVMKQLSSKRVRVELENKHSGFSPALCKDSLFEHEMYDYYM